VVPQKVEVLVKSYEVDLFLGQPIKELGVVIELHPLGSHVDRTGIDVLSFVERYEKIEIPIIG
jgi:hypothetical protein